MKNVSQPVLVIGKLLQEDRERFNLKDGMTIDFYPLIQVSDSKTGKSFEVIVRGSGFVYNQSWMTHEERDYLGEIVGKIFLTERAQKEQAEKQKQKSEWLDAYREDL